MTAFVPFTRRTNDPKLTFIEFLLDEAKIPNRRNGESFHAPILEIEEGFEREANDILDSEWVDSKDNLRALDDIPDDDETFMLLPNGLVNPTFGGC